MPKRLNIPPSFAGRQVRSDKLRPRPRRSALQRSRSTQSRSKETSEAASDFWSKSNELAIQLLLDPHVTSLGFRSSLSYLDDQVSLQMFVADLDDGDRVAFDLIDERPHLDLDVEGLLLLALETHGIRLIEIDNATIGSEPRASNTRRLWSARDHQVPEQVRAAIDRTLAETRRLTIRGFTSRIGLRDPMPTLGALVSQGVLAVDPSRRLGPNSLVRWRSDRWPHARGSSWFRKVGQ